MSDYESGGSGSDDEPEIPQEEKDADLFAAAKGGDLKGTLAALELGGDPTHTGLDGWTPLLWAVCNGHVEVTKTLMGAPHNAAGAYIRKGSGSAAGFGPGWARSIASRFASERSMSRRAAVSSCSRSVCCFDFSRIERCRSLACSQAAFTASISASSSTGSFTLLLELA